MAPQSWSGGCSSDGSHSVAVGANGSIYTWPMDASSWTAANVPIHSWTSVIASVDSRRLFALAASESLLKSARLYSSTDGGTNWMATDIISSDDISVAASADGSQLIAAPGLISRNAVTPGVRSVLNCGATSPRRPMALALQPLPLRSDTDSVSGFIYLSTDAGATWTLSGAPAKVLAMRRFVRRWQSSRRRGRGRNLLVR